MDYNNADIKFVQGMINHHKAALTMASAYYNHALNPEIKQWAASIYYGQKSEIEKFSKWLSVRGYKEDPMRM